MLTDDDAVSLTGMSRVSSAGSISDMRKVQSGVLRAGSCDNSSNVVTKSPHGSQAPAVSSNPAVKHLRQFPKKNLLQWRRNQIRI